MHPLAPLRYFALDALLPENPPKCRLLGGSGAFCFRVAHKVEGPFPTEVPMGKRGTAAVVRPPPSAKGEYGIICRVVICTCERKRSLGGTYRQGEGRGLLYGSGRTEQGDYLGAVEE